EIYGAAELEKSLAAAGRAVSVGASHAELLLAGYLLHGQKFFRTLNGAFVAAIWDAQSRQLHLVNDRFGMKPLYHTTLPGKLLFAAEIKSLLADPAVSRQPNPRGVAQFFSFGQLLCEDPMLSAVKVLPPAAWLTYDQSAGTPQISRYWSLSEIKYQPAQS